MRGLAEAVCPRCGTPKVTQPNGARICRPCSRAASASWAAANRPRTHALSRESQLRKYRLTASDFDAMVWLQDNRCAICDMPETHKLNGKIRQLSIDHDHGTGQVRSLVCSSCNLGLGKFDDSADRLRAAADYLGSWA